MKFDSSALLESIIWQSRLADLPRGENRVILQRMYNGDPPFDEAKAEENNVQVNRNFLEGTNLLIGARSQWHNAFLKPGNFFNVTLDDGPVHKRREWGTIITKQINQRLKRNPAMREQVRATGANVVLHGIGPVHWTDRKSPIPTPLPISGLLIASESDIDFDNLEWFAVFREWTPSKLYDMTNGKKVDPGWNMPLVKKQLKFIGEQQLKIVNAGAYQYMPERIEEIIKQDMGYWGSDAVPTIDVWDIYFREQEDGRGWYRRILLDWGDAAVESKVMPATQQSEFLYTSGDRKYADALSNVLHCQFGDCSAVAPFKYHSVRSLGWMLWGVCDLQNRLRCRFTEQVFAQLMWFFRVAGQNDFDRLMRADFFHMGVIPQGVSMLTADERFKPDQAMVDMALSMNRQLMAENAASFKQDIDKGESGKEMTATETMARVNAVNQLVSGMLTLAYDYEEVKYREIARRMCIKGNPDTDSREFRLRCLKAGVPEEMLDVEKWQIDAERVLGGGNKTMEMAQAQGLLSIRQNLNPDAQRLVDNRFISALTDDPALAESLAPVEGQQNISKSMKDAQDATPRLLQGLQYRMPQDAVAEDFVMVWLDDMATLVGQINERGGMATQQELIGLGTIGQHVGQLLQQMGQNPADREKVKQYGQALSQLGNFVKAYQQRLEQQQGQAQQGGQEGDPAGKQAENMVKLQGMQVMAQAKADNLRESHATKTAQRQAQFELEQERKDREQAMELQRKDLAAQNEMMIQQFKAANEPQKPKPQE